MLHLEPAQPCDGQAISAILTGWRDETPWMPQVHGRGEEQRLGNWLIAVAEVTVARAGLRVVGFLARQGDDIQALFVAPDARRNGVGVALLDAAKAQCQCLGLWSFQANTPALQFYQRNDFIADGQTCGQGNDAKLPDVHLTWNRKNHE